MTDTDEVATLMRGRFDPTPQPQARFELSVIAGPDTGARFAIDGSEPSEMLLGQSEACFVRLNDPEVSRRHVAFEITGSELKLRDLQSTNGTRVNGITVIEALLRGNEQIEVGRTSLRVERQPAANAPVPLRLSFGRLIGASREMRRLYPLLDKLAASSISVLIEGETGTGKELVAESLHEIGPRSAGPFVVLDCTAVPENLVESELFGHERGAFTGASASKPGLFELAHGGSLFIDEIGELDRTLQPKLLRVLEKLELRRVGGQRTIQVDVRVIAATNRNLDHEVQHGRFREDLFHRLAIGRVELPPLRRRRGDVPILARYFWKSQGGDLAELDESLVQRWDQHAWPGNVRELRNAVLKRLALGELAGFPESSLAGAIAETENQAWVDEILSRGLPLARARQLVVDEFERLYVKRILDAHGGNVRRAAAAAGVARRYFQLLKSRSK